MEILVFVAIIGFGVLGCAMFESANESFWKWLES